MSRLVSLSLAGSGVAFLLAALLLLYRFRERPDPSEVEHAR